MKLKGIALLLALLMIGMGAGAAENVPAATPEGVGAALLSALKTTVDAQNRSDYDFTDRAMAYLNEIGRSFPVRGCGSDAPDAFGDWLIEQLLACGYDAAQIEAQPFECEDMFGDTAAGRNILLTVPGQADEGQIIVGAHYDGEGLGDNGSGTALLLAAAAGLAGIKPRFTIKYIFFDGEEVGLIGSKYYAEQMSEEEIASTIYMVNIDALAFGDFCNLYGGVYGDEYDAPYIVVAEEGEALPEPEHVEGYAFAVDAARKLGFKVYTTEDLDGYFDANGEGMAPEDGAFFTNPWTNAHPAPMYMVAPSPATINASDHVYFAVRGIPYIYFEATNWWAKGLEESFSYTGYVETYDETLGDGGAFMNTEYDTLENLNRLFPGRAEQHFRMYSPLLSALLLAETPTP